eukprot:8996112-Heterocapsa_arctica.AAC.1
MILQPAGMWRPARTRGLSKRAPTAAVAKRLSPLAVRRDVEERLVLRHELAELCAARLHTCCRKSLQACAGARARIGRRRWHARLERGSSGVAMLLLARRQLL